MAQGFLQPLQRAWGRRARADECCWVCTQMASQKQPNQDLKSAAKAVFRSQNADGSNRLFAGAFSSSAFFFISGRHPACPVMPAYDTAYDLISQHLSIVIVFSISQSPVCWRAKPLSSLALGKATLGMGEATECNRAASRLADSSALKLIAALPLADATEAALRAVASTSPVSPKAL